MERFTKEELLIIGKALSPVTRVPASLYRKIYSVVKELFGQGRGEYFSEIHEYVAEENLNLFMRVFLKIGAPGWFANSAPRLWKHLFERCQLVKVADTKKSYDFAIEGAEAFGESICFGTIGWARKAIELSGGKNCQVSHLECINRGGKRCLFHVQWD